MIAFLYGLLVGLAAGYVLAYITEKLSDRCSLREHDWLKTGFTVQHKNKVVRWCKCRQCGKQKWEDYFEGTI